MAGRKLKELKGPNKSDLEKALVVGWISKGGGFDYEKFGDKSITETKFKSLYSKYFAEAMSHKFDTKSAEAYLKEIKKQNARVGYDLSTLTVRNNSISVSTFGNTSAKVLFSCEGNEHMTIDIKPQLVVNRLTKEVVCAYFKVKHDSLSSLANYIRVDSTGTHVRSAINLSAYNATAKLRKTFQVLDYE